MFRHSQLMVALALLAGSPATTLADDVAGLTHEIQTLDAGAATKDKGSVAGRIAADFESFAGSSANATSLVTGLRSGSEITLSAAGEPTAVFVPPTRPMGYGNISTSLALARAQLAQQGITEPTPAQLQTALTGGSITIEGRTVEYAGILKMRAHGMGWGEIAHSIGTKLGPVISGLKAQSRLVGDAGSAAATPRQAAGARSIAGSATAQRAAGRAKTSSGIVTAGGSRPATTRTSQGKGHAKVAMAQGTSAKGASGRGIVTASGDAYSGATHGKGAGKSAVVTSAGKSAPSGVSKGGGNGKAFGHLK
jgi:hypothetical protein